MADLIGQTTGSYRIEALIGSGGMGDVYRGVHVHLNRSAAIKVMHPHLAADPAFQARFQQEAKAAAALTHPHVVEVYDFGEQDGRYFLVLELVADGSLRTLLQRRAAEQPWPLTLGIELVCQTAEGLAYAHAQGMVHRDIKPDNLLLRQLRAPTQRADQYTLKISDFGLAKLAEGTGLTATGVVMGTPAYMSPEQCQGGALDSRSDLYSLGIVLYEVATGYLPFQAKTLTEAVYKHVNVAPPPPRQVRPDLPTSLEAIILRCLAKRPEDRYPSGSEVAEALRQQVGNPALTTMAPVIPVADPPHLREGRGKSPPSGTALQQVADGGAAPPPSDPRHPLPPSPLPRLRVQDRDGTTVRVVDLTGNGLTLGREQGNDVVLPHASVSRHHARIDWDGAQATVTDLGASNGTWMAGTRLVPQAAQPWAAHDRLRVGQFWLRLQPPTQRAPTTSPMEATVRHTPAEGTMQMVRVPLAVATALAMDSASSSRLSVLLNQETLTLTPGQPSVASVTLANLGATVDHLWVRVEGVPTDWVQGPSQEVQLNPGAQETVQLTINAARTAASRAGEYPVQVRALSREYPGEWAGAQARWTVLPFTGMTVALRPSRVRGRGQAGYGVVLRNEGNTPETCQLSAEDDEENLTYAFAQQSVAVEAGAAQTVPMTVRAQRRWIGKELPPSSFSVQASTRNGNVPLTAAGQFVNLALLPGWVPAVAGIALAGLVMIGALFVLLTGGGRTSVNVAATATAAAQQTGLAAASETSGAANVALTAGVVTQTASTKETQTVVANVTQTAVSATQTAVTIVSQTAAACGPTFPTGGTGAGTGEILVLSDSTAAGAEVFIDGVCQGAMRQQDTSALYLIAQVPPGTYIIRVTQPGYHDYVVQTTVVAGQRSEVSFRLIKS